MTERKTRTVMSYSEQKMADKLIGDHSTRDEAAGTMKYEDGWDDERVTQMVSAHFGRPLSVASTENVRRKEHGKLVVLPVPSFTSVEVAELLHSLKDEIDARVSNVEARFNKLAHALSMGGHADARHLLITRANGDMPGLATASVKRHDA